MSTLLIMGAMKATEGIVRPLREGNQVLSSGFVVSVGLKNNTGSRFANIRSRKPTPYLVQIWIGVDNNYGERFIKDQSECACPVGQSKKCKYVIAVTGTWQETSPTTMSTTVYGVVVSPPVRAVLISAKLIGRPANLKVIDIMAGDQLKPEFLKINPLHTVPTIDDEGVILFESNAIITYLADKYGKDDSLYPKDLQKRAVVNQRLFLNNLLFVRIRDRLSPMRPGGDGILKPETLTKTQDVLDNLETLIGENQYVAGTDSPTVADVAILATLDSLEVVMPEEVSSRPKLHAWLKRIRTYVEANVDTYREHIEAANTVLLKVFGKK